MKRANLAPHDVTTQIRVDLWLDAASHPVFCQLSKFLRPVLQPQTMLWLGDILLFHKC